MSDLPLDKLLHVAVSAATVPFLNGILVKCGVPQPQAMYFASGFTLFLGVAKELLWDLALSKGTPEISDGIADLLGTGAGFLGVGLSLDW